MLSNMLVIVGLILTVFITIPLLALYIVFKRINKKMAERDRVKSPMLDAAPNSTRRRGDDHAVQHREGP